MIQKITVIIPAAGLGKRFKDQGFTQTKPYIEFLKKTMLEHLIDGFFSSKHIVDIHIILRNENSKDYAQIIENIMNKYNNVHFHYINLLTEGTTATALFLFDILNNNNFTLLANCDQLIDIKLDDYIDKHNNLKSDGSLLCFSNENSKKWSFVEEENNVVKRIVAKDNISDVAVCGWYAWSKGKDFIKYSIEQIINLDKVNGEYYLCPVFNYAIKDGQKITSIKINKSDMHGVGTPEDLKRFIEFKGC